MLITGATSGIGRATAILMSEQGALCVINGRNEDRLSSTLAAMQGNGHIAIPKALTEDSIRELVTESVAKIGPLNGFVHCAGIEKTLPFRNTEIKDLRDIMAINLEAYWEITRQILKRHNHDAENTSIVAISSVAASGAAGKTAYSASKGALISLTKSLAAEYANKRIRFNCVCPAYVDTPMLANMRKLYRTEEDYIDSLVKKHPFGIGRPEDVAGAVAYLLSDASRWVTGTVMTVDGGYGVR